MFKIGPKVTKIDSKMLKFRQIGLKITKKCVSYCAAYWRPFFLVVLQQPGSTNLKFMFSLVGILSKDGAYSCFEYLNNFRSNS